MKIDKIYYNLLLFLYNQKLNYYLPSSFLGSSTLTPCGSG